MKTLFSSLPGTFAALALLLAAPAVAREPAAQPQKLPVALSASIEGAPFTIDGTQECLRMTPVLPYINHASDKIAEEILEQITLLARGTFRNVRKHLYPTLCKS